MAFEFMALLIHCHPITQCSEQSGMTCWVEKCSHETLIKLVRWHVVAQRKAYNPMPQTVILFTFFSANCLLYGLKMKFFSERTRAFPPTKDMFVRWSTLRIFTLVLSSMSNVSWLLVYFLDYSPVRLEDMFA